MNGHQIFIADDAWSVIVAAYLRDLGLPYTDLTAVRRQATDDEIRAAFVGKTVDFGPALGCSCTGRMAAMNSPSPQAEVRRGEPARVCTGSKKARSASNSSAGMRRCDKIMKVDDAYHLITPSGGQYPAQIR